MLSTRSWQCCWACSASSSSWHLSPEVNTVLSLLSDRKSVKCDSKWFKHSWRSAGAWQRTWVLPGWEENKQNETLMEQNNNELMKHIYPCSYLVQIPSRDISDVFEQVMPGHNTLHVNMLLMPQRHDLLVQLLYPTCTCTHRGTQNLLIIIVTPNLKPLPIKMFLSDFICLEVQKCFKIYQPHFSMAFYWDILYSIKVEDFAGKERWKRPKKHHNLLFKRLERCLRKENCLLIWKSLINLTAWEKNVFVFLFISIL